MPGSNCGIWNSRRITKPGSPAPNANPGVEFNEKTVAQLQAEAKAYGDALFDLKKQSAEELYAAQTSNEERKNVSLTERDQQVLEEAASLGLTEPYSPLLATPIGDGLTIQEERWNDSEKKEVVKLEQRNSKALSDFRNGGKLLKWGVRNLHEEIKGSVTNDNDCDLSPTPLNAAVR